MRLSRAIIFVAFFLAILLLFLVKKRQETIEFEKTASPYEIEYVENFVSNSSFELGNGNLATGWETVGDGKIFFERDAIEKFDGKFSANITSDESSSKGWWEQDIKDFPRNKKFILYGAVKSYNADTVFMRIEVYDTNGNLKSFNSTDFLYGTNDWKVYSCAVIVDENVGLIKIKCVLAGKGRAWFDDVETVAVKFEEKDYPFWWKYWTKRFTR